MDLKNEDENLFLSLIKCRACLSQEQEMYPLFREFEEGLTLGELFNCTTSFEVNEADGGSAYLCDECTNIVVGFFNFKKMCVQNEKYIQTLLESKNAIKSSKESITTNKEVAKKVLQNDKNKDEHLDGEEIENNETLFIEITDNSINYEEILVGPYEPVAELKFTDTKEQSCLKCGEKFSEGLGLYKHMFQKHTITLVDLKNNVKGAKKHSGVNKKFICDICGTAFLRRGHLADHLETHSTEKRHLCPECGKSFRLRSTFVQHKKTHTQPRKYICDICGQRFNHKASLQTHTRLKHTEERNYSCPICQRRFNLKSTLQKHIQRHDDDRKKDFSCDMCPVAYIDKKCLTRHILFKHTEGFQKPTCLACGKQYNEKVKLKQHMKTKHTINEEGDKMKAEKM